MFENNGMNVTDLSYYNGNASITFSDSYAKRNYITRMKRKNDVIELDPIEARAEFDWLNARKLLYHQEAKLKLNYEQTSVISFRGLPEVKDAKAIRIKLFIEDKLMCYMEQPLSESQLL
jgi:hypothetical protein